MTMACDICGKTGRNLEQLRDCYQLKEIKEVCDSCKTKLNKQLSKLQRNMHFQMELALKAHMLGLRRKARKERENENY
jgi:hypothetical protein